MSTIWCQSSSEVSHSGFDGSEMPALLIQMSTLPNVAAAWSQTFCMSARLATSPGMPVTFVAAAELGERLVDRLLRAADDGDLAAALEELAGEAEADASGAAGDDDGAAHDCAFQLR